MTGLKVTLKQIENQALRLSDKEKAELVHKLLLSLDNLSDEEVYSEWLVEAQRRAKDLDEGRVKPVSYKDVRRKVKALLR